MPVALTIAVIALIAGPILVGMVARRTNGWRCGVLIALGAVLPPLIWTCLWLFERMTQHDGDFTNYSDGDIGIILLGYLSVPLMGISALLTLLPFLFKRKGRQDDATRL